MTRIVLVPVDGSHASRAALRHALTIAAESNGTVYLLAVVDPGDDPLAFGTDELDEINQAIENLASTIANELESVAGPLHTEVRRSHPVYEEILEYADEIDADQIVLGRHGTSSLPAMVFGSTADRVARFATIPVTLVPESAANETGADGSE